MDEAIVGTRLAVGRTAEVFQYGAHRVLKLYREGWGETDASAEYENNLCARHLGLPVPDVFEMVVYRGRRGIISEFIDGEPLTTLVVKKPWKIFWAANALAQLHVSVHGLRTRELPALKNRLEERLSVATEIDPNIRARALELLRSRQEDDVVCHGDFHPDNVLLTREGLTIIDWLDAASGSKVYDFARTMILLRSGMPEATGTPKRLLIRAVQAWFARIYAKAYRRRSEVDPEDFANWTAIAAAVRLTEVAPDQPAALLRIFLQAR